MFGKWVTAVGIISAAGLTRYTLKRDTSVSVDGLYGTRRLTTAGKRYSSALIALAVVTAGAFLAQNYAQGKLDEDANAHFQKAVGDEVTKRFGPLLDQVQTVTKTQKDLQSSVGDLNTVVHDATSTLQRRAEETAKILQRNNLNAEVLAERAQQSIRDVQLSNVKFQRLILTLALPGAVTRQTPALIAARSVGESRLKTSEDWKCTKVNTDGPDPSAASACRTATKDRKAWEDTFDFFGYFDPDSHLYLQVDMHLTAFAIAIRTTNEPPTTKDAVRAHEILIRRTDRDRVSMPPESVGGSPSPVLELRIQPNQRQLESSDMLGYYSRDSDISSVVIPLQVKVCDYRLLTEGEATVKKHLSAFPSEQVWVLTVTGLPIAQAEHAEQLSKRYVLRPVSSETHDNCMTIDYR